MPATAEPGYVLPAALRGNVTIAPDAIWTDRAATWPVTAVSRETDGPITRATELGTYQTDTPVTQLHLDCARCGQQVYCLSPDISTDPPRLLVADLLAGILAHLRRSHADGVAS